ncbi:sulfatase-like hydrolase/transferase [bacterium]|nr:sulfatase-like hydrolase/transferase [bacterium]
MTRQRPLRGWLMAGWIGVLAGLLDTGTPILHPAPAEAIPLGISLYAVVGIAVYLLASLAVRPLRGLLGGDAPSSIALGLTTAAFAAFLGFYFVSTSTWSFLLARTGQMVGLALAVVLALTLGALVAWLAPRTPGPGRYPLAAGLLVLAVLVYPVLMTVHLATAGGAAGEDASPQGLVIVSLDAMRGDRITALGYPRPTTPHIDELVRTGTAFSAAYVESPASAPGHASMLTGLPPLTHGLVQNTGILHEDIVTVAERLRAEGFATAALINNYYLESRFGFDQGFDLFVDRYQASHLSGFHPHHLLRATALFHTWARLAREPGARNDDTIDGALAWLRHRPADRFFLFLHIMDPHAPYAPPPDLEAEFCGPDGPIVRDTLELRARQKHGLSEAEIASLRDLYDADVALADRKVGRLVAELKRLGLFEHTLLVITADHGEVLYERGRIFNHGLPWNGNLHVPLVFHLPERAPAGLVVDHPVPATALVPTAFSLLDLPYEAQAGPPSHAPLLESGTFDAPDTLVFGLTGITAQDAATVTSPSRKLVVRQGEIAGFFDLVTDPTEQVDLWPLVRDDPARADECETAVRMQRALEGWLARTGAAAAVAQPSRETAVDADTRRRLRSLGYVD